MCFTTTCSEIRHVSAGGGSSNGEKIPKRTYLEEAVVITTQVVRRYFALLGRPGLRGAPLGGVLLELRRDLPPEHADHLVGELRDLDEIEVGAYLVLLSCFGSWRRSGEQGGRGGG